MTPGERARLRFLFSALGCVPVFLAGWLGYVQVLHAGELRGKQGKALKLEPRTADVQQQRRQLLPAPRGTLTDRHGAVLAIDCESYEVRAQIAPPRKLRRDEKAFRDYCAEIVQRLADALSNDPGLANRAAAHAEHTARLELRMRRALRLDLPWVRDAESPLGRAPDQVPHHADMLVDTGVRVLPVIEALRAFDDRRSSVLLDFQLRYEREQPEHDVLAGLLGKLEDVPVEDGDGTVLRYETVARFGLESMPELRAGAPGARQFHVDAVFGRFYAGAGELPAPATHVTSTLDVELQKVAVRRLEEQALAAASGSGKDGSGKAGKLPLWGALVLVEIETGDVLAAASWQRDARRGSGSFAPYQRGYEPGSIVKPLVFAYALQYAGLDWQHVYDCSSPGKNMFRLVEETGRKVRDDHVCGALTPHGILVNSSNIGAVKVGARLSREQWDRWFQVFGIGRTLGLPVPHERVGGRNEEGWKLTGAKFVRWSASSYSFGYEFQTTALQMARAYLTLLSGRERELRLVRELEIDGVRTEVPVQRGDEVLFDRPVIDAVTAAMVDVVGDADPNATGRRLLIDFRKQGIELHGLLAGKTGTAVSRIGNVEMRNASFVGFLPANEPRYLAVCILQRDDAARFYGGSYAAPAAAHLLLEALRLEERRRLHRELQVSASPGEAGRGGQTPEQRQAGR